MSSDTNILEKNIDLDSYTIDYQKLNGRGGAFLITPIDKGRIFSRELFTEEHKMFDQTAKEFAENRILPVREELNILNRDLSVEIFKEMGELGFLGVDVDEEYGGLALDKTTACIIVDALSAGRCASILVTMSAHTGIAMLPLIWYGNDAQKKKYLSRLASGELMGCYSLTEPGAGSDALSGSAKAYLNNEGTHYIINGQKIYVTNGGWADMAITFANVEGKYTAFIIDKDCDGWVIGEEEKKMGIKGSSTVTFFFEDCKVPVENVLGKVGEGGPIAFNVLYVGRYKLGVTTASGAKYIIDAALDFAFERKQFNHSVSDFDMIKRKFANMVTRCWEGDSLNYMITGSIDHVLSKADRSSDSYYEIVQKTIEDHGIEASISKIVGSDTLAYVADEGVQIFGGAGFIEEYPMACTYRDERINRIFEGTNEINRLIIGGTIMKKAILEEIPIRDMIQERAENWLPDISVEEPGLTNECKAIEYCRSFILFCLHESILKFGQDLKNKQWIIEPFANMVIGLSIMDTGYKRFLNIDDEEHKQNTLDVLKLSISDQVEQCNKMGMDIVVELFDAILAQEKINEINKWYSQTGYLPHRIDSQKKIVDALYKYKKYYLDV